MGRSDLARLQMMRRRTEMRAAYDEPEMRRRTYRNDEPEMRRMTYRSDDREMRRPYEMRAGYDHDMPMGRRMGFGEMMDDDYGADMRRRRENGTFMHYGEHREGGHEPIRFGGMVAMEGGRNRHARKVDRETAEEWVEGLENADPAKPHGGKWTAEQIKPIATRYGVPTEGEKFWEFYAVMNMLYSDYYAVAKKYNALTADFFADMAMAFISDKDASDDKVARYFEYVAGDK